MSCWIGFSEFREFLGIWGSSSPLKIRLQHVCVYNLSHSNLLARPHSVWMLSGVLSSESCGPKQWHWGWKCSISSEHWYLLLGHRAFPCPLSSVGCCLAMGKPLLAVNISTGRWADGWLCVGRNMFARSPRHCLGFFELNSKPRSASSYMKQWRL